MRKIIYYIFGHKANIDSLITLSNGEKFARAKCKRCMCKMVGRYSQGELSKEWFWTFIKL